MVHLYMTFDHIMFEKTKNKNKNKTKQNKQKNKTKKKQNKTKKTYHYKRHFFYRAKKTNDACVVLGVLTKIMNNTRYESGTHRRDIKNKYQHPMGFDPAVFGHRVED